MSALFLSLEGIDGAGKSSHLDALEALFRGQGRAVTRTREPGGTPLAERLREMVLHEAMDPLTESLLVFAARRDHVVQVIEPALARGDVVICDRFTDATFAYQGGGRGFDLQVLDQLERWVQHRDSHAAALLQPDLTLWFDLPPEVAAARLADARTPDKFEAQSAEFFRRVSAGYARRAAQSPRFARIDAERSREAVWEQVHQALTQRGFLG
ncbi:dTMP kinase [Variovorax dokdonensis]|uniref:Thymidylate kinase n=1 Tax=Variovorax dokdonensis TaxID=344883 RepID=A0ABT7NGS0_9BURK|nr:dTMP kinase [Variovorax dokdonensis]MDM0047126.1 dTMP kinase [Variovorax dokdonensis]